ncbi:hypothetical protein [Litoribrevibacter albus]|uniref:Uncharacterized protein n=1 Tax=Litoribrevibacter albus TaxID=1473156 RepID=A0AA37S9D1_9GAMM|nr:hypothetical protein [Litoribrevibacter albus]GLQ30588.1 hypothetical protein GCM10007876_10660 [Litoribrevibacter albus]
MMFRSMKYALVMPLMLLAGCLPSTQGQYDHLIKLGERPLQTAQHIPTDAELAGDPTNVWVYIESNRKTDKLDIENEILSRWAEAMRKSGVTLHSPPTDSLGYLGQIYGKRSPSQNTLKELIQQAGYSSSGEYLGRQTVDYVVEVKVNRSTFLDTYSDPTYVPFMDPKRPGSCDYEMEAHLDINIKPLPQYRTLKSYWLESSESDDIEGYKCPHSSDHKAKNLYKQMRKEILEEIGDCGGVALQKFLTPKGYILNYFSDGKEHIFEISGGTAAGFHSGQSLNIFRIGSLGKHNGDLLGEATVEEVKPKRSLIKVSDPALIEQIKKYDLVKVENGNLLSNTYNTVSCSGNITEL